MPSSSGILAPSAFFPFTRDISIYLDERLFQYSLVGIVNWAVLFIYCFSLSFDRILSKLRAGQANPV